MSEETKNAAENLSDQDLDQASGGGDPVPMDSFSLNFTKVEDEAQVRDKKAQSRSGSSSTATDDVYVEGKIITG